MFESKWAIILFILSYAPSDYGFFYLVLDIDSAFLTIPTNASLSIGIVQSECFISSYNEKIELYGEVTTSSFFEGKTEAVNRKISGN